jgi:hypothetical protein
MRGWRQSPSPIALGATYLAVEGGYGANRRCGPAEARRVHNGVSRDELSGVVNGWVECVLGLNDRDLRHLDRLVAAQKRLRAQQKEHTRPALPLEVESPTCRQGRD